MGFWADTNIRASHILVNKNIHFLKPVKEKLDLKVVGVYCVSCMWSKVHEEHEIYRPREVREAQV